jgi:DNA-directed RNA polymerase subunit RPC12/RpoP
MIFLSPHQNVLKATLQPTRKCGMFSKSMSEFKYACPVCGQHISCDVSQAGSEMTCPTCFQKIVAPQVPLSSDTKLILNGIRASDRRTTTRVPRVVEAKPPAPPAKNFPGALVVGIILIFICTVVAFIYHGTIFKTPAAGTATNEVSSTNNSATPTNSEREQTSNSADTK